MPAVSHAQNVPQGYSVDIEFMRPSFGHGSFVGVDVPMTKEPLAWRYGALVQYEDEPLTIYDAVQDIELGSVVVRRIDVQMGLSIDLTDRLAMGFRIPMAYNAGTQIADFGADGFGVGDVAANAKVIAIKTRRDIFNLGPRVGLSLPTGRQLFYVGERGIRADAGLIAVTNLGPVRLAADSGVMLRSSLATSEDFFIGNEMRSAVAGRVALPAATRTAFTAQAISRSGLQDFLKGGAENGFESVLGVQVMPARNVVVDIGGGRGFNEGYGTTDLRVLGQITIQRVPTPPEEIIAVDVPPPPPPPPPPVIEELPEPEPEWEEGQIARIVLDEIQIREQLEFFVNTANLQAESVPTLLAVAGIINGDARIGHVVVEGHASQEGSHSHNYELSERRSRTIFEELFKAGVHPSRISYRSMGEVVPLDGNLGEDEASLQKNRRVEFHIVKQFEAVEDMPDYDASHPLPWSGEMVQIKLPPKPEAEAEEDKEAEVDEYGLPIDDSGDEIDMDSDEEEAE
jgi:outer membrane protein OmpA-like peptidoglycan-associated protein